MVTDDYLTHETKRHALGKFILLLLILAGYASFVLWEYGLDQGILITCLTWSFFVLCTPIADAGFLFDFPVRLVSEIRMIYTEASVWVLAASLNVSTLIFAPHAYGTTGLLKIFYHILTEPWPYYSIIVICAAGTFLSVIFGDELMDVASHKHRKRHQKHRSKHWFIIAIFIAIAIILLYYRLLQELGIQF